MTPEQFCYWLQGRAELDGSPPTPEQWQAIREHLALVFTKVTPPFIPAKIPNLPTHLDYPPQPLRIDQKGFPQGTIVC